MQRFLADGSFLRVYLALALALLLSGGLAVASFLMVDHVRREHYHEQLAVAPMALLTAQLSELPAEPRDAWLAEQQERLDIRFSLHDFDAYPLNYFERSRLAAGRTLVSQVGEQGWQLYRRLPGEPLLLSASLASLSEHQLLGLAEMLGDWLVSVQGERRLERLEVLQTSAIPLTLSDEPPEGLDSRQLERLHDAEVVIRLLPERWAMSLYLRLPAAAGPLQWVQVGPLHAFEPMPLTLTLLLAVIILLGLAGTIYLIVRGVEARLTRLELAAERIAGGRLDTRVKVEGGGFMGRVGMAFNAMAVQVQSLLRAQQEMIRAVSHELRTPVARIRFAMQMVEDMTDDPAVHRQLQGIDGDIEELDHLIDEILTYAQLDSGIANGAELERSPVECRTMAQRVIETLAPLHGQLRIELAPGEEAEVLAEPRYLQRALQNLVANACRHAQSRVLVRITAERRVVRFDVEDDGPGVPESERQVIFKPFARLDDSRTRHSGGYGLGLSIVERIMAWHGGSVLVDDSAELGGGRFSLLLPQPAPTVRQA
ncbi:HAMP domain-containing protein [Halomonas campisalis]|uniref:histidine kinase n=1 Tax=Billgrantia campisalis TaxID=74661 RepID=A0ABS9PA29_9GAMM|nr:ATP-binding protein [Halomonas campisalis]MCG6658623.1 HAMP domain-containing protein [Halomonas campisalis]MDR5863485.1 ATP-binding protein [Halomonas campisalis]